jgi:UDP-4-amino-4,6-dideoxy-N-acetyl-beta-L-altrosamine N-acetyltransferase
MTLSMLTESDCTLILPWRNAPAVRLAMYNHHAISPEEHRAWFECMQSDPGSRWYLYHDRANVPRGVVYFTSVDVRQRTSFWGFYTSPEATPGTGMRMALDALELAFAELGLDKLNAEVLVGNTMSLNFHKKVGFTEEGLFRDQHFDGVRRIDVIRLGMLANEWPQNRERLKARIAELDALAARRDAAPPPQNRDSQ